MTARHAPVIPINHARPRLRTADEARRWLRANGITVHQFARDHGFQIQNVKDLLHGKTKGNYGESHLVAVALGMKADPKDLDL